MCPRASASRARTGAALLSVSAFAASIALVAACSDASSPVGPAGDAGATPDTGTSSGGDAGGGGDSSPGDAATDAPEPNPIQTEVEPNNGSTATDLGTMKIPGTMNGKIDPANDVDIFSIAPSPGEFWEWTLTPSGADLAPNLTVFDTAANNLNPTVLVAGAAGSPILIEHFVLRTGTFVAAVRDARNVPTGTGKGGPTYGYSLVAKRKAPAPIPVTFPSTKSGKLKSLGAVDLYTFTGTNGKGFDIVIRAARLPSPSTLDSRLSLFDITGKKALITNDDAAGTSDSQVGSPDPAPSTYMVIVENEGKDATNLSYEIEFTLRP
ncbi:MAG: hypothetical protein JST00_17855 [Deltaproteobacteria bacterium]|nr:hypothetical protein [Deltaproteobacteria bacterium]